MVRRTQAERRAETRLALLDATLACLSELGYARTTTTEVVRRAELSQGALFAHFPTKSALVAAAAEQLFGGLIESYRHAFRRAPKSEHPAKVALKRLWELFLDPKLRVVYLLYAEAPMDPELHAALRPVVENHTVNVLELATVLFPELATSEEKRVFFETAVFAMQGASLQRAVYTNPKHEKAMLAQFARMAEAMFSESEAKAS